MLFDCSIATPLRPAAALCSGPRVLQMAGPSWLIDSKRIASKIKNASAPGDPSRVKWISNPTKPCPRCSHMIDNSDVVHEWPGLPRGVKFDPSDQELMWHLLAKVAFDGPKCHPFINEFIPTVEEDDGICYTHPQKLPGVKQDGSVSHFFHRTFKAYNTGTRKRRKINSANLIDVRWHKTGKTKPVIVDGKHLGCKKIMVLYMVKTKGGKPEKTNWVMHQYHLGAGEDEKDGEYVVSKIFYQQQPKPGDKMGQDQIMVTVETAVEEIDPVPVVGAVSLENHADRAPECDANGAPESHSDLLNDIHISEQTFQGDVYNGTTNEEIKEDDAQLVSEMIDDHDNHPAEEPKWWEGESQYLLDSQQLAEGIAICDEFLMSQSSCNGDEAKKDRPRLADYAHMGVEDLKRDLEECQKLDTTDPADIELDTPPDFRLSQLEFGSQDSFLAWDISKVVD